MKKTIFTTLLFFVMASISMAQTWQNFNYQGVARDAQGDVIENQAIGIRFSLHEGTAVGTVVYQETHSATTNEFGLFNLVIGGGTVVSGTFGTIDWGTDDFFVQVEMDPAGGIAYADMGTSQLLSVPYAMHAANAGALGVVGTSGQTLRHDGSDWIASSSLFNDGIKVGVGQIVSGELDGVFTVRGQNSTTDGIEGVFLDIINDETNTAGTLAGIRFCNYPVNTTDDHIPGGIFWKSDGQTFGRGDLVFVTGTAGGSANVNTNARMTITNDGRVGIGTSLPDSKLQVTATSGDYAIHATNSAGGTSSDRVIYGEANHAVGLYDDVVGVYGNSTIDPNWGYGVYGSGGYIGVRGDAIVSGDGTRYGAYGRAGNTTGNAYGVYGTTIGTNAISYSGYFNGDVYSSGSYLPSDRSLKLSENNYDGAIAMVKTIPVKTYSYKQEGIYSKMNLPEGEQVGIMAQDLQLVMPQLVKNAQFEDIEAYEKGEVEKDNIPTVDFNAVNYTGLIPVLVKGMQEQQELIEQLQAEIELLKNK